MTNEVEVSLDKPLEIGDQCVVRWRGGDQTLPAVIIERRPLKYRKRKSKKDSAKLPAIETLKPEQVEYYVHFVDHDRYVIFVRLAETISRWAPARRLTLLRLF